MDSEGYNAPKSERKRFIRVRSYFLWHFTELLLLLPRTLRNHHEDDPERIIRFTTAAHQIQRDARAHGGANYHVYRYYVIAQQRVENTKVITMTF